MSFFRIIWDARDDPHGNVRHVAEHGLEIEDVEEVLANPTNEGVSVSSGRPCVWGYTLENIYIIVIYEEVDEDTIRGITAYDVPDPRSTR